jgi:pseudomonalisin
VERHRRIPPLAVSATALAAVFIGLCPPALAATPAAPTFAGLLRPANEFTRNVLPGLVKATDLGAAPGGIGMDTIVSVARPDPDGERALLDELHSPTGPRSGRFLSVTEFANRFGVPAGRLAAVRDWLVAGGLRVSAVSSAGDQITATGTVEAISGRFRTAVHVFDSPDGHFLANISAPWVPRKLGIVNVVGLNTAQRMRPSSRPAPPGQTGCVAGTCTGGTTPKDLWSVYQQPSAFVGRGQRVAIFGAGATDGVIEDLRLYEDRFGLSRLPVRVRRPDGESESRDDANRTEWNLDTQAAHGMAPGLDGLDLYFGRDLSDVDVAKVFSRYTDDQDSPRQASASYGECETVPVVAPVAGLPLLNLPLPVAQGLGNNLDVTLTAITRQAALEGRTIFSSSGDTGSSCPAVALPVIGAGNGVLNQGVPLTNSPAGLPYVVAVGGTVLYTDRLHTDTLHTGGAGHRAREYGWPYSGGGSAQIIPAPAYQVGTRGMVLPCLTGGPGRILPPAKQCRGVPDVAAQSGDITGNGYDIVSRGKFVDGGGAGTSLSSPLWVGMWARVQSASDRPGGLGFANYSLYRVGKDPASYRRDFFDVTSTDPRTGLTSTNGLYPTLPGWDYVTGFGAPRVAGLICDLAHRC